MAVRGRKPKPRTLKLVTGNPGKRELPTNEPEFTSATKLGPPAWLKRSNLRTDFMREWGRVTKQLEDWDILGEVNQGAIEGLCLLYAQATRAAKNGDTREARQSFDAYRKALNEFGLTPASKGRVGTGEGKKPAESKAAGYFKKRGA